MVNEDAKPTREARSFPRIQTELTELGSLISGLWKHVKGASHIVGISEPQGLTPDIRDTEGPVAPMVSILNDIKDFKKWIGKIDQGLDAPLRELVPEFYENIEAELEELAAKEKKIR